MTEDQFTIDDALAPDTDDATGEADVEAQETATETPTESEAAETPVADETATPAEETDTGPRQVPVKALTSEREKRQAAERDRDELRKQLEALKKPPEEDPKPKTSVFDDEEGFRKELMSEAEIARHSDRYDISQALAEDKWGADKVAEAAETYKELVKSNPQVVGRMFEALLPYYEMMKIVEEHQKLQELEDPDALRERIRAEERAKLEKEAQDRQAAERNKRDSVTPSLASARSAGSGLDNTEPKIERAEEVFPD